MLFNFWSNYMKYKNKFLFICFIIFLFTIASVCASDIEKINDDSSDDLEIKNQNIAVDGNDILSTVDENLDNKLSHIEEEPALGGKNSEITIDADSIYVNETAKISITVNNATGYVVVSVDNQTFNKTLSEHQVKLDVSGLTSGSHNIAVFYSGDNYYLPGFKLDTLYVNKHPTEITAIDIGEVSYGDDANIIVTVPKGVEGDIIIKLNDDLQTNITGRINNCKAEFSVANLGAGNYTVNAVFTGNNYYGASDVKSANFEVKKADSGLALISFSGTVYDSATLMISINGEIHDEYVNVTVGDVKYYNCPIEDGGLILLRTEVLDKYAPYNIVLEYGGNENFKSSRIETTGTANKITTYGIKIIPMNIFVNDDEIITVEVPDHVDDVVIWVDGKGYRNTSFTDNKAIFKINGLSEGIHTVTATVNDTEFDHRNYTTIFTVSKVVPSINIFVLNETPIQVGDNIKVIVSVPDDVSENVSIMFDGIQFSQKPVGGNATFNINVLSVGDKVLPAIYNGDKKYRINTSSVVFTVFKRESFVNISAYDISINDNAEIVFTLPGDASGNITAFVNEKMYIVAVSGGKGILMLPKLHNGVYNVTATYNGDEKYHSSRNNTISFNVIINSDQMDIIDEGNNTISVYLDNTKNGNLTVEIDGKLYNGTVDNGVGRVFLINATLGTHHARIVFVGSSSHEKLQSIVDVHVPKYATQLSVSSSIIRIGDVAYINVTAPKSATGNITIEVEGKSYTKAIDEGIAKFEIIFSSAGNTTLFVKYAGDECYMENSTSGKLTVFKQQSNIIIGVDDIKVGDIAQIRITGPGDISGTVIVNVNGIDYTTVLSNGFGIVNVSGLQDGKYEIVASYLENANYLSSSSTQNITVSKIQTVLSLSNVVSDYNGGKYLVATLKDINGLAVSGVRVSFNINGVKYLTTDANGQVKLSLMNIVPNNYDVAVNFEGNGKYVASKTTVKVTIKKATPKLSAAKKTFKRNVKIKKYSVTLKTNDNKALSGVNVVLKINNMKITAKTNAAGKATFNIKKLFKKGTYKSSVIFAGNKFYNAVTKKVKIKIR